MTLTNRPLPLREPARRAGPRPAVRSAARRRHASSFSDGVVAAYIHEISGRNRRPQAG
jgi:hypothetical protein